MQGTLQIIDKRTASISDDLLRDKGAKDTKKSVSTVVITFLLTIIGGIVVAIFQGWINIG